MEYVKMHLIPPFTRLIEAPLFLPKMNASNAYSAPKGGTVVIFFLSANPYFFVYLYCMFNDEYIISRTVTEMVKSTATIMLLFTNLAATAARQTCHSSSTTLSTSAQHTSLLTRVKDATDIKKFSTINKKLNKNLHILKFMNENYKKRLQKYFENCKFFIHKHFRIIF